jgi:NADH dehydrogenase FAD-containing subunit
MDRRQFLLGAGAGGLALAAGAPFAWGQPKRAVIVGGGFAGASLALELRRLAPAAEITLVEREREFMLVPASIDVAVGHTDIRTVSRSYAHLARTGIRVLRAEARGADPGKAVLDTTAGPIPYTLLAVASGIRLAAEEIPGLKENPKANLSLYDRAALPQLQRQLRDLRSGNVIVSVPPGALRCPPAPYEYAVRVADMMALRRINGKVIVIDGWPTPQPGALGDALAAELTARADRIEYVSQTTVSKVDPKGRKVMTDFDTFDYAVLSLTPTTKGGSLVAELGLADKGDAFAAVDPLTLRTQAFENVFALGDAARVPYGKSGSAAIGQAKLCAVEMARALGAGNAPLTRGEVDVACFHAVHAEGGALRLDTRYTASRDEKGEVHVEGKSTVGATPSMAHETARRAWHHDILASIGG